MTASPHHPFPSKLDLVAAEDIRARHRAGEAPRALAAAYGVAVSSLYDVLRGRTHPPRLLVPLGTGLLAQLDTAAHVAGVTKEDYAAALIERALAAQESR
jgi:hypothetical protein